MLHLHPVLTSTTFKFIYKSFLFEINFSFKPNRIYPNITSEERMEEGEIKTGIIKREK